MSFFSVSHSIRISGLLYCPFCISALLFIHTHTRRCRCFIGRKSCRFHSRILLEIVLLHVFLFNVTFYWHREHPCPPCIGLQISTRQFFTHTPLQVSEWVDTEEISLKFFISISLSFCLLRTHALLLLPFAPFLRFFFLNTKCPSSWFSYSPISLKHTAAGMCK